MKDRPIIVLFSFLIALLLAACQPATTEDSAAAEPQAAAVLLGHLLRHDKYDPTRTRTWLSIVYTTACSAAFSDPIAAPSIAPGQIIR